MFRKFLQTALAVLLMSMAASSVAGELRAEIGRKLDPKLRALLTAAEFSKGHSSKTGALFEPASGELARVLIKIAGGREALKANGARVIAVAGDVVAALVPLARLADIAALNEVAYIESSKSYRLFNDVGVAQTQAAAARQQYNLAGRNVIFGCIDSGIDWRHDDFRKSNGQTRIKYLLDFSDPGDTNGDGDLDGSGPYGGTLYTEAQINAALSGPGTVREIDRNGHGSHVTGSAAGNGRGTSNGIPAGTYAGVATEADIIFVKASRGDLGSIPDVEVINTLAFVDSIATSVLNRPYVLNLSLGGHEGAHDGTSLQEQAIDSFVGANKRGKAVVIAAGNDGDEAIHAGGTMSGSAMTVEFNIPTYTANAGTQNDFVLFDLWYTGTANLTFQLNGPTVTYGPVTSGNASGVDRADGAVVIDNASGGRNPLNNDKQVVIQIFDNSSNIPKSGTWRLTITGASGRYDLWMYLSTMGAALTTGFDFTRLVAMPGTARNAITVGAWISKKSWTDLDNNNLQFNSLVVGAATDFSNPGPTRDGRTKPDICAPGQMIGSTYSTDAPPNGANSIWTGTTQFPNGFILRDNRHAIGQGTSFAAPLVAGGVALMLERFPTLDAAQIRNALITTADTDNFTGTVPNNKWGYGKVDLLAAVTTSAVAEHEDAGNVPASFALLSNFPNPFSRVSGAETAISFHVARVARVEIAIFDLMGRKVKTLLANETAAGKHVVKWNGRDEAGQAVSSGVYFYKMRAGKFAASQKLLIMR